ncbi:D-alanyl-D-alanine carboxypeptidase (penicillin-binding protein 5/6) [Desulfonispora thiosulfatigenes DSM 11270]|uniref:D-alanyl-D-alanine carboxypeptidase (Penicillin-binding protein 5/6) n=1 Tax=Desulfonispora thiosulfatigenes DSM 11270 TaxID=656914 RepID=A0A1W1V6H8_DESTI|nr:stalk domain-containing protein [Desulfonispora thiosulfatigenes]SMB88923.1 D-alanyl-D-alanine carboxypeptidase (penicillin-binding protein 5/6) [Desulfonispora thiosulfatigenes DSM 11270]
MLRNLILGMKDSRKGKQQIICSLIIFAILFLNVNAVYALDINSPAAALIEFKTGKIIYEKDSNTPRPMASTTKIMTYLLTLEAVNEGKIKLSDNVKISKNAANSGGSAYNLKQGDIVTVNELLASMLIISASDSAVALAEYVGGSVGDFAAKMNEKAKSLGLTSAYFINPHGIPLKNGSQNHISPKDLALLAKYTLDKYGDHLISITSQKYFNGVYRNYSQKNTNKLLETTSYTDGLKTGFTTLAGFCLVSSAKVKDTDNRFIAVIMGGKTAKERNDDSKRLLEYGLNNFEEQIVIKKGEILGYSLINSDEYIPIEFIATDTLSVFTPKYINLVQNKEIIFITNNLDKDILNQGDIKAVLKLNDGTEREIRVTPKRGISVFIDDEPITFEGVTPIVKDNTTLLPLRKVTESLGGFIEWDPSTSTITGGKDDYSYKLTIDSKEAVVNGESVGLLTPPLIIEGSTMVPIRFVAESLGMEVKWDSDIRAVKINNKE